MKRDQRIVQSETAIIEAGIKTFISNPLAGMSDIALASGVGRTTLYRHYESREVLVQAIALHCFDEIDQALRPLYDMSGRELIENTFELLIPIADRYRFLSSLWHIAVGDPLLTNRLAAWSQDTDLLMEHAKNTGEIDPEIPSVWLTAFFDTTLYAAWSLLESEALTIDEITRLAIRSFFKGCGDEC